MNLEINSIWDITGIDGVKDSRCRILALYYEVNICVIYEITEDIQKIRMPKSIFISDFHESILAHKSKLSNFDIPAGLTSHESKIPLKHRIKRDNNFLLIQGLIEEPLFLLELISNQRSGILTEHAKLRNTYSNKIYRFLNKYWMYGQIKNALLPAWYNSGGKGVNRIAGDVKRGSPGKISPFMDAKSVYRNVSEEDKKIFIKSIREFSTKGKKKSLHSIYDDMSKHYYRNEIYQAEKENSQPVLPSYDSFRYWIKKLIPESELVQYQSSSKNFALNKRALIGSATDHTEVPGSCFELDATVLDVHIVSSFNREWILGRPTVYLVIDKESRMVVGLHVSMEYASWRAGRQALVNAFTNKKRYCSQFGLQIDDAEWPCHHLPQKLLCDRGEFVCEQPEILVVPVIGTLLIAPSGRADMKGIVERHFKILNDNLVHQLSGTTNGKTYVRGEKDPRLDACFTLQEVTVLLIKQILEHNHSTKNTLLKQSSLMVATDLPLTPQNYWNIHLNNHRHALRCASESEIRSQLLPPITVSMTDRGIRLNKEMFYQWDSPEFSDLKIIARNSGRWKLEARVDQDNSDFIYVKIFDGGSFVRCDLMRMSALFGKKHNADIECVMDWNKRRASLPDITMQSVKRYDVQQEIIHNAEKNQKEAKTTKSKSQRLKKISQHRQDAIKSSRFSEDEFISETDYVEDVLSNQYKQIKSNQISQLKRIKTNSNEDKAG